MLSGAGSIQAMITALKNNRKQRKEHRKRFKTDPGYKVSKGIPQKEVPKYRLKQICKTKQKENRRLRNRRLTAFIIVFTVVITGIIIGLFYV